MNDSVKFFLPGPVYAREEIKRAMCGPTIGHRSPEFSELYNEVVSGVQRVLFTKNRIFLSSSTATGLMEAAVRNVVRKKSLNLVCGAFSELWHKITLSCGHEADALTVDWGKAIKPEMVEEKLATGEYDTVCVTHSETSTGVLNPLAEIAEIVAKHDDVALLVDAVSSMAGVKIDVDALGIDVCLASVQKAWALPPGFAVASISDRALERSKSAKHKGFYFDFEVFKRYDDKSQTISTASIPHMYALKKQIKDMETEGLDGRFARHQVMAERVREWVKTKFKVYAEEGYRSPTVTAVKNETPISTQALVDAMRAKGYIIPNGYGKIKNLTFRIGHMGDVGPEDIEKLIETLDEVLGKLR